jgi:hypothetical protein
VLATPPVLVTLAASVAPPLLHFQSAKRSCELPPNEVNRPFVLDMVSLFDPVGPVAAGGE